MVHQAVFVATQAQGTKENQYWLEAAKDLNIAMLIFSLDKLDISIINGEIKIQFNSVERTAASTLFLRNFQNNFKKGTLIFDSDELLSTQPLMIVRRLGKETKISRTHKTPTKEVNNNIQNALNLKKNLKAMHSFLARLDKLEMLEEIGITIVNSSKIIQNCMNKYIPYIKISEIRLSIVKMIPTQMISTMETVERFCTKEEREVVIKPLYGSKGQEIKLCNTKYLQHDTLSRKKLIESLQKDGSLIIQKYIKEATGDARILLVDFKPIAIMDRIGAVEDQWVFNIHKGAIARELTINPDLEEEIIADSILIAKSLNARICGIDLLHNERHFYFLEANSIPGLISISKFYNGDHKTIFHDILMRFLRNA